MTDCKNEAKLLTLQNTKRLDSWLPRETSNYAAAATGISHCYLAYVFAFLYHVRHQFQHPKCRHHTKKLIPKQTYKTGSFMQGYTVVGFWNSLRWFRHILVHCHPFSPFHRLQFLEHLSLETNQYKNSVPIVSGVFGGVLDHVTVRTNSPSKSL